MDLLQAAISGAGVRPVAPCKYNFGVTDVASFVTLSAILESVGTSAYLGAAPFVGSKDILAVAASIMVTEALHTSLQRSSIGGIGAPDPFGTVCVSDRNQCQDLQLTDIDSPSMPTPSSLSPHSSLSLVQLITLLYHSLRFPA